MQTPEIFLKNGVLEKLFITSKNHSRRTSSHKASGQLEEEPGLPSPAEKPRGWSRSSAIWGNCGPDATARSREATFPGRVQGERRYLRPGPRRRRGGRRWPLGPHQRLGRGPRSSPLRSRTRGPARVHPQPFLPTPGSRSPGSGRRDGLFVT